MVSHLLEEAIYLGQRIGVMGNGELKEIITVDLPSTRNRRSKEFYKLEDRLYKLIRNQ